MAISILCARLVTHDANIPHDSSVKSWARQNDKVARWREEKVRKRRWVNEGEEDMVGKIGWERWKKGRVERGLRRDSVGVEIEIQSE